MEGQMTLFILIAAILGLALSPVAAASAKKYAPGQRQVYPGQAKQFAPGQKQRRPGQAKQFAPGQQAR
jgi:hypothetical protein